MVCITHTKGGWVLSNKGLTVYPLTTEDGMNVPLVLILIRAKYFSLFFSFINQAKILSTEVTEFGFQGLNGHFQMNLIFESPHLSYCVAKVNHIPRTCQTLFTYISDK